MQKRRENENIYRTTSFICIDKIDQNRYAIWNKYMPKVMFANEDDLKMLELLKANTLRYNLLTGVKRTIQRYRSHMLLFNVMSGDNYKKDYLNSINTFLVYQKNKLNSRFSEKIPFVELSLVNNRCNLQCSYCIAESNCNSPQETISDKQNKLYNTLKVVDNFMKKKNTSEKLERRIVFNGGEILLEHNLIKKVISHISNQYDESIKYYMNTNGTLLDSNKASYIAGKFEKVAISIDGTEESHNKTRVFHNGTGSFNKVLKGLKLLRQFSKKKINAFQGTICDPCDLDYTKLKHMKTHDFYHARLGVNLLNVDEQKASELGKAHVNLHCDSLEGECVYSDGYINAFCSALSGTLKEGFSFHCSGLTHSTGMILYYNIDTNELNLICSFAKGVNVKTDTSPFNIYTEKLFQKGYKFLENRISSLKKHCIDCELIKICKAGCFTDGLNSENSLNKAACSFKKSAWATYLKRINIDFIDKKKEKESA